MAQTIKQRTEATAPPCPTCSGSMKLRTSTRGQFYGCAKFPRCKGTARLNGSSTTTKSSTSTPQRTGAKFSMNSLVLSRSIPKVTGSVEQDSIWSAIEHGSSHIEVNARAGTGKSFTIFHAACRVDEALQVGVLAFNKPIAGEMQSRFDAAGVDNCQAVTFHSLGYGAIRAAYGNVRLDSYKYRNIIEDLLPLNHPAFTESPDKLDSARGGLFKLCSLTRNYIADARDLNWLREIADRHNVEMGEHEALIVGLVNAAIEVGVEQRKTVIDFDDMLYIAVRFNLRPAQFDLLLVDEAQDTNPVQMKLAMMAVKPHGRVVQVGDEKQAIYGWRGSHIQAMREMRGMLYSGYGDVPSRDVDVLPLTVTRRCPKSGVRLAQCIVPDIQALPDAVEGEIHDRVKWVEAVRTMHAGDMVLCRVNRYLIPVAYALLRRGVKAVIRGRDIGANVTALISRVLKRNSRGSASSQDRTTTPELMGWLSEYREAEEARLSKLGRMGEGRLASLEDQCETLIELSDGCESVSDIKAKITALFADFDPDGKPNNAVICSTIHGAKGLEADNVYILNPELMPHPKAEQGWEMEQELNLIYVAVTRFKHVLRFVAGKPGVYKAGDGSMPRCLRAGMENVLTSGCDAHYNRL